jgi:hypothetical protein
LAFFVALSGSVLAQAPCVDLWERFELVISNEQHYDDPNRDVTLHVTYTQPNGETIASSGVYIGGTSWRIHFTPFEVGTWEYEAVFSDGWRGASGTFECSVDCALGTAAVGIWDRFELSVTNTHPYSNRYRDVTLNVTYTRPNGSTVPFWGFYDGGTTWRIRFMPDQIGTWSYNAVFSDGRPGASGTFQCMASTLPGMLARDETNPRWIGYKGGNHVLVRSFHCGDRFFAANWPDSQRQAFLNWAEGQGYNMLSIASHYLNRDEAGRGAGWDTPALWNASADRPEAEEYQEMEVILDDLADRRLLVFPFAGFIGRASEQPSTSAERDLYLRYTMARVGPYWNVMLNVAGPELGPFNGSTVSTLGNLINNLDVFDHLLGCHQHTNNNLHRNQPWVSCDYLQGPKTTNLDTLYDGLSSRRSTNPLSPIYGHEVLWHGNSNHPDYTDTQLRKNAWVMMFAAVALNFADNDGNSSSGFSGSMNLSERNQSRHDIIRRVWDYFETTPFYSMTPRQDLTSAGYCLANPGSRFLVYLPSGGNVSVNAGSGPWAVEWINAQNTADRHLDGTTSTGAGLSAPSYGDDWILSLTRGGGSTNLPPSVNAGPDRSIVQPASVILDGTVTDDGLPSGTLTIAWSQASGPGTVTFANASAADTTASFSSPGTYTLRLTASDGVLWASDGVSVSVSPSGGGGGDGTLSFPPTEDAYLQGSATFNNTFLRVENDSSRVRTSFIKFVVSGVGSSSISSATLRLRNVDSSSRNGTYRLSRGSHNDWTETNLANPPSPIQLLATRSGPIPIGTVLEFDVTSGISGDGTVTFILHMDPNSGSDLKFSSSEGGFVPELRLVLD